MEVGKYTYGHIIKKEVLNIFVNTKLENLVQLTKTVRSILVEEIIEKNLYQHIHLVQFIERFFQMILQIIENDVWIGQNVTIIPGVRIGSIIVNNSHVIKSCPEYSIIGGNPAKIMKKRFSESQIEKLLEIKWWDWGQKKKKNILQ